MRAYTKTQAEVKSLHERLHSLSDEENQELIDKAYPTSIFYRSKITNWCTCCGKSWISSNLETVCPYCKSNGQVEVSRKQKYDDKRMALVVDTLDGWQVLRFFEVSRWSRKDSIHNSSTTFEVVQAWYHPSGKREILRRPRRPFSYYWDAFTSLPMCFSQEREQQQFDYSSLGYSVVIEKNVLKEFEGFAFDEDDCFQDTSRASLYYILSRHPLANSLIRDGHLDLVKKVLKRDLITPKMMVALNVAIRHKFNFKKNDVSSWMDMVNAMIYLGDDILDPKNVAPKRTFMVMHNTAISRMAAEQKRRRRWAVKKKLLKTKIPMVETLIKSNDVWVERLAKLNDSHRLTADYLNAIKIARRTSYDFGTLQDFSKWSDYIANLIRLGKDIHNAYYVAPKLLDDAYRKSINQIEKHRIQELIERNKREAQTKNDQYVKSKGAYFNIDINDGVVFCHVLQSVAEFVEEGATMHHCVYQMGYYNKPNSLILSARVDGKRMETVEVNLRDFTISQSRAVCNGVSKYHNEIVELVNSQMHKIREVREASFKKKAA